MLNKLFCAAIAAALMSSAAAAADYGVVNQAAPAGFEPINDWTGFYAGIFAGGGGGESVLTLVPAGVPPSVDLTGNSFGGLAGIQVGVDYQLESFVVGAVADIALTNISVNSILGGGGGPGLGYESSLDYLGTVRARFGFLPTDGLLAYVHGGLAYGQTSPSFTGGGGVTADLEEVSRLGYTVGVGLEYMLTENLSFQTEYAFTNLGEEPVGYGAALGFPAGTTITEDTSFHTVKAGVNYRF